MAAEYSFVFVCKNPIDNKKYAFNLSERKLRVFDEEDYSTLPTEPQLSPIHNNYVMDGIYVWASHDNAVEVRYTL